MKNIFYLIFICSLCSINLQAQFKTIDLSQTDQQIVKEPILIPDGFLKDQNDQVGHMPTSVPFGQIQKPVQAKAFDQNNKPIHFEGHIRQDVSGLDLFDQAKIYFQELGSLTRTSVESNLQEISRDEDDLGMEHLKANQTYLDIPIYGAELIFHSKQGLIGSVNGDYVELANVELSDDMKIGLDEALSIIQNDENYIELDEAEWSLNFGQVFKQFESKLMWYSPEFNSKDMKLAWVIDAYTTLADRYQYIIDANTGEILRKLNTICKIHGDGHPTCKGHKSCSHKSSLDGPAVAQAVDLLNVTRTINTYDIQGTFLLIDATKEMFNSPESLPDDPQGAIWTIDGNNTSPQSNNFDIRHVFSNNNTFSNSPQGVSAHFNAEQAYEYFKNTHNRESINGAGGTIVSIVNVSDENGNSMDNAFWNGFAIFYGNGAQAFRPLARALDVAGHEMSHGVVQSTANLEYFGESGALNESFSDVFGAMIDREDWQVGEDVVNIQFFPSGALRDLEDPHNGAATGDFGRGWQPKHTNEQFTGQQDNNGVHINSGIPNHAYYRFAIEVGRDRAERIWYRALTNYLTRSSQFVDMRNAVINAAQDLHGNNSPEVSAAQDAFSEVGIGEGSGTDNQTDVETNPGDDLLLFSSETQEQLFIANLNTGDFVFNPLSETAHISRPSITDDGTAIIFVADDRTIHLITIDWQNGTTNEQVIQSQPIWRNAVISKDGARIAALTEEQNNIVSVFDFGLGVWNDFELFNPTFTEGIETGDVDFADAMEFDITGEILLYDARNILNSSQGTEITYWDIGFLEVWNNSADTWRLGNVAKLFSGLPEGISVGNPTYSKNSPFIVAFDFIEDGEYNILGVNVETGDVGLIYENNGLGYPSYSNEDDQVVFDITFFQGGSAAGFDLGTRTVDAGKITGNGNVSTIAEQFRWPIWFSNGERALTNTNELEFEGNISIFPNPVNEILQVDIEGEAINAYEIHNQLGQKIGSGQGNGLSTQIDVSNLESGTYLIQLIFDQQTVTRQFQKF